MSATEKYLFEMRMDFLADDAPLSDADLAANLGAAADVADTANRNPNPLTASGLVDLLGVVIERTRDDVMTLAGLMGLDGKRLMEDFNAIDDFRGRDPKTVLLMLVERELGRRGLVARPLTKWLVKHTHTFAANAEAEGWDRQRLGEEIAAHLDGGSLEYGGAVRQYFDAGREHLDTEAKLAASCVLMGWDYEAMAERAAVLEYDAGLMRTKATMRAVWFALRDRQSKITEPTAQQFFDLSSAALERERANGWERWETIDWICGRLRGELDAEVMAMPATSKRAG